MQKLNDSRMNGFIEWAIENFDVAKFPDLLEFVTLLKQKLKVA